MNLLKFKPDYSDVIDCLEWSWGYYSTSGELDPREVVCMVQHEIDFHTEYLQEEGYTNEEIKEILDQMGFVL
jgi:hypothetical protein